MPTAAETEKVEREVVLRVDGMMCQKSCGTTVTNTLLAVPGVISAAASFEDSNARIVGTATVEELIEAVEMVGFDASEYGETGRTGTEVVLRVEGMMCQKSCGTTVTNALLAVPGVISAAASFEDSNARIVGTATVEELIEAVEMVGFDASAKDPFSARPKKEKSVATAHVSPRQPLVKSSFEGVHGLFEVRGMSCSSCSAAITRKLETLEGINQVNVALLAGKLETIFDPSQLTERDIVSAVESIGFACTFLYLEDHSSDDSNKNNVASMAFEVMGMSCAACSGKIEKQVGQATGVLEVSVNLMTNRMNVKAQKGAGPGARDIIAIVGGLGYRAVVANDAINSTSMAEKHQQELKEWQVLFGTSLIFAVPIVLIHMIIPTISAEADAALMKHIVPRVTYKTLLLWLLATPVQFGIGRRFHRAAWNGAKHCNLGMDFLVSLGTSASYVYSCASVLLACMYKNFHGQHTFESSALLLTFVVMGKLMESYAKGKTSDALSKLLKLKGKSALIVEGCRFDEDGNMFGGEEKLVDIELVQLRDVVKVLPGSTVPADGSIIKGRSTVDESMISGESMPVTKEVGCGVYGGTLNIGGTLYVRITRVGSDTALSQILRVVQEAQTTKAPIEKIADKISGIFAPTVIFISVLTFILWFTVLETGLAPESWVKQRTGMENPNNFVFSFLFSIAVLVVACPCALGLATPTAVMVGTGVGAANGILIKGGNALEMAHRTTAIVFDKTGTLTKGKPEVTHFTIVHQQHLPDCGNKNLEKATFFSLVASAELGSEHPLAASIVRYTKNEFPHAKVEEPVAVEIEPGLGLKAVVAFRETERAVIIGNRKWMELTLVALDGQFETEMQSIENDGATAVAVAIDGKAVGIVGLSDTLKDDAVRAISALMRMGVQVHMITGDNKRTADKIASKLNIPETNVQAEVLPQHKAAAVQNLQSEGHVVAMVGDGINDSPALAQADIGIALGQGSEIAIDAASVVLIQDKLEDVVVAMHLSRHVFRRIVLNFIWALGYNTLGIPLAAGVFYPFLHIGLPPQFAGLAMAFSSVSVVSSSLHLRYYKRPNLDDLTKASFSVGGEAMCACCNCMLNCFSRQAYRQLNQTDDDWADDGVVFSDQEDGYGLELLDVV